MASNGDQLRKWAVRSAIEGVVQGLSRAVKLHPLADPKRHNISVLKDIPYMADGKREHCLDIYQPTKATAPLPIVLYVHGGGFNILSKDTHWIPGLILARLGYLVFNINYRLAPRHPFPAALEDTCAAYSWLVDHAPQYGGDLDRLVFAGESAGANLITALSIALCYERPEAYAREVFNKGVVPQAVIPACGILQVSQPDRFQDDDLSKWVMARISALSEGYLGDQLGSSPELADPLLFLEKGDPPSRPLPSFNVAVGTKDPVLEDSRRLESALRKMGVSCEANYYEGEFHAFHLFFWRPKAKQYWRDLQAYLDSEVMN